jgi:hypothetical protein
LCTAPCGQLSLLLQTLPAASQSALLLLLLLLLSTPQLSALLYT